MVRPALAHVVPCTVAATIVSVAALLAGHSAPVLATAAPPAVASPPVQVRAENVAANSVTTLIRPNDSRLGWVGHWAISPLAATTVNSGSRLRFSFTGTAATAQFDTARVSVPAQLYVMVDGAPRRMVQVDRPAVVLAAGLRPGRHTVVVDVKAMSRGGARWRRPLSTGVTLTGLDLGLGGRLAARPPAARLRLEFYGDSVIEGVGVTGDSTSELSSDATASFAALTAAGYRADGVLVGFAGQGVTQPGLGAVGSAAQTLGSNLDGSHVAGSKPSAVVINYGSNDGDASAVAFRTAYTGYLRRVRANCPAAWIFAVAPFNGTHAADVRAATAAAHDRRIVFVDTVGWVSANHLPDGLHPDAAGHRAAATRLIARIRATTGWRPPATP